MLLQDGMFDLILFKLQELCDYNRVELLAKNNEEKKLKFVFKKFEFKTTCEIEMKSISKFVYNYLLSEDDKEYIQCNEFIPAFEDELNEEHNAVILDKNGATKVIEGVVKNILAVKVEDEDTKLTAKNTDLIEHFNNKY